MFLPSSIVGKQCTVQQVRQFMIVVDLVFHREGILKSEVWNRLEAVQRSLWGSDKWAADYVTNIQLKINQSLHDGEQLTPSEKKNCRDRWDQGAFKNLARSIIFSPHKTNFSYIMCRVLHLPTYFVCFQCIFFCPNIQWCYFLTNFRSGQLSTFNFGTLGDQVANNQL